MECHYDVEVLSEEEFSKLSSTIFGCREFASDTEREAYFAETFRLQEAVREQLAMLGDYADDWEVGHQVGAYAGVYNCGGIYSERMLTPAYVRAILKTIAMAKSPQNTYYNTVCEIIIRDDSGTVIGDDWRGEFYISQGKVWCHEEMSEETVAKLTAT